MKVLLVEDEIHLVSFIKRGLEEEGHEVSVAMDGVSGVKMIMDHVFDVVLLDVMLPGKSGIEVCREIRSKGSKALVIMLTALGSTENIVSGLDSGADDYLVKPFKFDELNARLRSLMRRGPLQEKTRQLSFADLEMNTDSKTVTRGGKDIVLTATEYKLLEFLLRNNRRVLSRVEILEQVWDINFDQGTNVVDVYINYLRKKIDRDHEVKLIHTAIGMGYVLKESP